MSYCLRCGEKNLPQAEFCENCGASLPAEEREKLQPGYGYDIYSADCRHKLKIEPMTPEEKLSILGHKKGMFLGNLLLIFTETILTLTNLFRTDNDLLKDVVESRAGLFGPNGAFLTGLFFLVFLIALFLAANPVYSRNTYNPIQLIPAMILEAVILPLSAVVVWKNFYFGDYMGTTLTPGGCFLLLLCLCGLILQLKLIREYKKIKKSRIYSYVAN